MTPNYAEVPLSTWPTDEMQEEEFFTPSPPPVFEWTDEQKAHLVPGTLVRMYDGDVLLVDRHDGRQVSATLAYRSKFDADRCAHAFYLLPELWPLSECDPSTITLPSGLTEAPWISVGRRPSGCANEASRTAAQRRLRMTAEQREQHRRDHAAFIVSMRNIQGKGEGK